MNRRKSLRILLPVSGASENRAQIPVPRMCPVNSLALIMLSYVLLPKASTRNWVDSESNSGGFREENIAGFLSRATLAGSSHFRW
jgi:hypothetical protein